MKESKRKKDANMLNKTIKKILLILAVTVFFPLISYTQQYAAGAMLS